MKPNNPDLRRQAFTIVELLVVVAVIGILVGLILPSMHATREAARRAECQNNLRQVGLALLNFESVYGAFPASGWTKPGPGNAAGSYLSWRVMCLGFIEQSKVATQYDLNPCRYLYWRLSAHAQPRIS